MARAQEMKPSFINTKIDQSPQESWANINETPFGGWEGNKSNNAFETENSHNVTEDTIGNSNT